MKVQLVLTLIFILELFFRYADLWNLTPFIPTDVEWAIIVRLLQVLKIFVEPTKHLSSDRHPTLHTQLSYYGLLLHELGAIVAQED